MNTVRSSKNKAEDTPMLLCHQFILERSKSSPTLLDSLLFLRFFFTLPSFFTLSAMTQILSVLLTSLFVHLSLSFDWRVEHGWVTSTPLSLPYERESSYSHQRPPKDQGSLYPDGSKFLTSSMLWESDRKMGETGNCFSFPLRSEVRVCLWEKLLACSFAYQACKT